MEQPDYWVSGVYALQKVAAPDRPKRHAFRVMSAPRHFRGDRIYDTIDLAKSACDSQERLHQNIVEAGPVTPEQGRVVADAFAEGRARDRQTRTRRSATARPPNGLVRREIAGQSRPNEEVLAEWQAKVAENPMWSVWYGEAEDIFRWRVAFDCGCTRERLSRSDDPQILLDHSDTDVSTGRRLPPGQYRCSGEHENVSFPLRDFASWDGFTRRYVEADPVDCPDYCVDLGQEWWDRRRRKEPGWIHDWDATLTCGHPVSVGLRDVNWKPEEIRQRVTPERLAELRARYEDEDCRDQFVDKMLEAGWPALGRYRDCDLCPVVRKIVAFEPLGWLVPPPPRPRKQRSPRERMQARLMQAEREAERIREELKGLDGA
ncbi:hypothetical protein [Mycobacterium sp. Root265]|uniref:hypothetical protein n=1 Tax=Mycobacterium sp. Root265 TaxID=1736504 RepID=UPI0012E3AB68|nr:hypothetical protein [Mycobacterium sp. Root265]